MSLLDYVIVYTILGSLISLIGGVLLLLKQDFAIKISHLLSAYAAGTLLGTAYFDLIPEAHHHAEDAGYEFNYMWVLLGILIFFLLERFIHWFHHTHVHQEHTETQATPLIIIGDTLHNFIDGIVIAITFMSSIPSGIITTIVVASHEIPQEIGDFGVLLKKGMKASKVLWVNVLSASISLLAAIVTYYFAGQIQGAIPALLGITAGFFTYIALSDLIPDIHHENRKGFAFYETVLLIAGVLTIYIIMSLLGDFHGH